MLRIGSNWEYEIKTALKNSDFVILLLSSTSVRKRGYVQKEFKYALEYSENKLIDDIYIVPILLDDCKVPEHLTRFQWMEIVEGDFLNEILKSLNFQQKKYLIEMPSALREINDYGRFHIDLNFPLPLEIDYECNLPLFHSNKFFDSSFVNIFIQQKVLTYISDLRNWVISDKEFFQSRVSEFYLDISHSEMSFNDSYLSLSLVYHSYFGGAHPNTHIETLNFVFNPERLISIQDIVECSNLPEFLGDKIKMYGTEEQKEALPNYVKYINLENINFTFNDHIITIYFINQIPRVIMALGSIEFPRPPVV